MATTLLDLMRREGHGRVVMLHPNIRVGLIPDDEYRARLREAISMSTIVKASDADLAWLHPDLSYQRAADHLIGQGARLVVVTLGAEGPYAVQRGLRVAVAPVRCEVADT